MSSSGRRDDGDFMSNFDPELVHRVLLTEPADFHLLTASGSPRESRTPTYEDFVRESAFVSSLTDERSISGSGGAVIVDDMASRMSRTMKRVFHDNIISALENDGNFDPLRGVVLDLHSALRSLVPNRSDLHGMLSDEDVWSVGTEGEVEAGLRSMIPLLVGSAEALSRLESEDRSQTTVELVRLIRASFSDGGGAAGAANPPLVPLGLSLSSFVVSVVTYLYYKAGMCQTDVADFKLANILAPRIKAEGVEYERSNFQVRYGKFNDIGTAPVTRDWICGIIDRCDDTTEDLRSFEERRAEAVQTIGWVDAILFHEAGGVGGMSGPSSIAVPEVLAIDIINVRRIRDVTRLSVAGSALALHACTVSGAGDAVLRTGGPSSMMDNVEQCRVRLVKAMDERVTRSREQYEAHVSGAVVKLARALKPSLSTDDEEVLSSRSSAVLRGEDPVIKLLNKRMKEVSK